MKILHLIADLKPSSGGPPKAALEMCQGLVQLGHDVSIFTTNLGDKGILDVPIDQQVDVGGVRVFYYSYGYFRKWPVSLQLTKAARGKIKDFDIVEIHSLYLFHSMITAYYCRKFKIPYLIRPHGTLDPYLRKKNRRIKDIYHILIENRNLNKAAAVHYTAEEEMNLAHYPLKLKSPAIVVPLGLNLKDYSNLPTKGLFRSEYPGLVEKTIILFLGRINFKKGLDLLAKAFGQVIQVRPDARLVIAGPEDEGFGDEVRQLLEENGVLDRTKFTGMLKGVNKLAAFVDADMFVLPSYSENFGISLAEAMACGVPVITTDKVNIWKDVEEAEAGEVIHCDVEELKKAILKLIDNPDLRTKYGANGRKLVEEKFNLINTSMRLSLEYEKLIELHNKR